MISLSKEEFKLPHRDTSKGCGEIKLQIDTKLAKLVSMHRTAFSCISVDIIYMCTDENLLHY